MPRGREEIEAFDRLGPKARKVIAESPLDIDLHGCLRDFRQERARVRGDALMRFEEPVDDSPEARDTALAEFIDKRIRGRVPAYKPIERVKRRKVLHA